MNKKVISSIVMAMFLAACSSKAVKEEPKAAVEDKSQSTTQSASTDSSATTSAATTQATAVNPLKDPNNILSKRSIYFDFDKDEVKAEFRPLVEAHSKYLNDHADAKIAIQGNADERGSREYNLALGQRRAVAVKKAMNVLGVGDKQIETVSYGEEKPACADKNEACWSQNRRADVVYAGE